MNNRPPLFVYTLCYTFRMASTTPGGTRYVQLNVRLKDTEKAAIEQRARLAGQTVSDFVRTRALSDTAELGTVEQQLVGVEDAIAKARQVLRGK